MTEPSNSKVIVEAEGIVKMLGDGANEIKVLKGIDLELQTGELTLMMGPSGSGKTTLLSILGCILSPTQGKLSIAGHPTQDMSKEQLANLRRTHVGFVFQSYNLVPTLSAVENVMLALDLRGINGSGAYDQAAEALVSVGLSHRIKAMPSKMSGGEKQRVSIARALAGSPSVILADEPTAALDCQKRHGGHGIARTGCSGHPESRSGGYPRPPYAPICRSHRDDRRRADCRLGTAEGFRKSRRNGRPLGIQCHQFRQ